MWSTQRKMALGGVVAAVVIGGGGGFAVAHAQSTSGTPVATPTATSTASPSTSSAKGAKAAKAADRTSVIGNLKDFQHAEWVSKGANGFVTHDAILGKVTAVSATSITVLAADGTSQTFAVDSATKVKPLATAAVKGAKGKKSATSTAGPTSTASASPTSSASATAAAATITDVTAGQTVLVSGEKNPDLTAKNVLVRKA